MDPGRSTFLMDATSNDGLGAWADSVTARPTKTRAVLIDRIIAGRALTTNIAKRSKGTKKLLVFRDLRNFDPSWLEICRMLSAEGGAAIAGGRAAANARTSGPIGITGIPRLSIQSRKSGGTHRRTS